MKKILFAFVATLLAFTGPALAQSAEKIAQDHLYAGTLAEGERLLAQRVAAQAPDRDAHLALALIRTARAVERLAQNLHRHGLQAPRNTPIPILRMPVPPNPRAEPISYAQMRVIHETFQRDLIGVQKGLEQLSAGPAKIRLDLHEVRLDVNGDGRIDDSEKLATILAGIRMLPPGSAPGAFPVAFDESDAIWLRGYTHLMGAFLDFILAHNWQEAFEATAHVFFAGARNPSALAPQTKRDPLGMGGFDIADGIALMHLSRFPVVEPERMKSALANLKAVVRLSRENWKSILAETDDEAEWVPAPQQKNAAITALTVTQERVDAWASALDEFEGILEGRILMPHWRYEQAIDFPRVFTEPRPFDLVLWMTGHAAIPYLREGQAISSRTFWEWQRVFGNNFAGYMVWFN
ncbi:MAG: hypothetical protein ACRCXM_13120 [Beijerinckiaceae bacterium]